MDAPAHNPIAERFPGPYAELKVIARRLIDKQLPQSLTPTELAHEAYLRLCADDLRRQARDEVLLADVSESVFKACFGTACRDVLVERYRARTAEKRGGGRQAQPLTTWLGSDQGQAFDVVALEDELRRLEQLSPTLGQLVEMRVFGDMTVDECAELLGMSKRSVERRWRFARAELHVRLNPRTP